MDQNRDEERRFTEQVGLADVLDVFDTITGPVVTSGDVATVTGCPRDSAQRKLKRLHNQGRLGRRKTAGRVVYWRHENAAPNRVNTDDTIFTDRSSFSSGHEALSEQVDELLYQPGS